ncbi:MAG: MYXO-CTERM sorting domain-containing protein [Polyangiaceae bacterium]
MLSRRAHYSVLVASMCSALSSAAHAHISLDSPKSRYYVGSQADQNKLKYGPCGVTGDARTTNTALIATFKPGQTITVKWRETVQHPGFFRIAFDSDGQDFTLPGTTNLGDGVSVLADKIADKSGAANLEYTYDVTLPNVECTKCTLQLVQVMTTSPPPYTEGAGEDLYFNCADIVLKADAAGSGGSSSGGASNGGTSAGGSSAGGSSAGGSSAGGATSMGGRAAGGANAGGTTNGGNGSGGSSGGGQSGLGGSGVGGSQAGGATANGGSSGGLSNNGAGGQVASGGASATSGGVSAGGSGGDTLPPATGCSCRLGPQSGSVAPFALLGLVGFAWRARRRRKG